MLLIYSSAIYKRFHRLESHIVTLAKSVAHLSAEVKSQHLQLSKLEYSHSQPISSHASSSEPINSHASTSQPISTLPAVGSANEIRPEPDLPKSPVKVSKLTKLVAQHFLMISNNSKLLIVKSGLSS